MTRLETEREVSTRPGTRCVLVLQAGSGASNNLIRSLRAGDRSLAIIGCNHNLFFLKKSCADRNYLITRCNEPGFLDSVCRVADKEPIDLVIPTTDDDVKTISAGREQLPLHVFLPRDSVIDLCQDKYELTTFLSSCGIPAPATYPVRNLAQIDDAFQQLAQHKLLWCRIRKGAGSMGAVPVKTVAQARNWITYWAEMRGIPATAFTLSEYLPGRDFACQSLWKDGQLVLIKTSERLSYFGGGNAPSGVSSVGGVHKIVHEPRVADVSAAAVRAIDANASGAFSVDLKEDASGNPRITEINVGRFLSGTLIFDLTGKHNMAVTYVRLALGEPVHISAPYDATQDYYMARDLDTLPQIFHADEVFSGVDDVRS